ncbi:hypothetical protein BDR06DRAFT_973541 [Suillus hirtellus]|nr:hypothetical protein BDR06DRAFT_973541 [Suillus hirtellus]
MNSTVTLEDHIGKIEQDKTHQFKILAPVLRPILELIGFPGIPTSQEFQVPTFDGSIKLENVDRIVLVLTGLLMATIFGGIHGMAWFFAFPTHQERVLWHGRVVDYFDAALIVPDHDAGFLWWTMDLDGCGGSEGGECKGQTLEASKSVTRRHQVRVRASTDNSSLPCVTSGRTLYALSLCMGASEGATPSKRSIIIEQFQGNKHVTNQVKISQILGRVRHIEASIHRSESAGISMSKGAGKSDGRDEIQNQYARQPNPDGLETRRD